MQKYFEIAHGEMGVKEVKGQIDNPKIVQYFADVGHSWIKDDETAWCAAFVGSRLERSGNLPDLRPWFTPWPLFLCLKID